MIHRNLLAGLSAIALAHPAIGQELSIATFNTYWMYDEEQPYLNWRERRANETYEETLAEIAGVILQIDADILSLQEIENRSVVEDLVSELIDKGLDYPYVVVGEGLDPFTGQNVALLSKYPPVISPVLRYPDQFEEYADDRTGAPRIATLPKFIRADFDVDGKIVTVFAAHLKSQRGGESAEEERIAQTKMVRRIVRAVSEKGNSRSPSYVAIAGDLNDDIDTPTLRSLRGLHDGSFQFQQPARKIVDATERYTHEYCPPSARLPDGSCDPNMVEREMLDHVLVNYFLDQAITSVDIIRVDPSVSDHDAVKVSFSIGSN